MPAPASLAEQYRAHRAAFLLAQELGCTPREAEAELRRRAKRERHFEKRCQAAARLAPPAPHTAIVGPAEPEEPSFWWKKD